MTIRNLTTIAATLAAGIFTLAAPLKAQDAPPPPDAPAGGENRGDRRGGNPEDFRKRMQDRLKASLKVSDEEWAVIQPLVEKVQAKQREAGGGRGGFGGGGRRGGGGGQAGSATDGGQRNAQRGGSAESQALRTTLENENASPEEIQAKLSALRDSRKRAGEELAQAREELRKVLTVRQEASFVLMGMLE